MIKDYFLILRLFFIILMSAVNLIACNNGVSTQDSSPTASLASSGSFTPKNGVSRTSTLAAVIGTNTPPASLQKTPGLVEPTQALSYTVSAPSLAVTSGKGIQNQTATPICNRAAPGNPIDITIPDDTPMQPGQSFTKTWRILNIGKCPWTRDYAVVFFSGKSMGASQTNYFSQIVAPSASVDVSLDMVSPMSPGIYQGNWKISDGQNKLFGIGPNGDSPFWVRIVVLEPNTSTPEPVLPTSVPTAAVATSGVATLKLNDTLDLDNNKITAPPGDVLFSMNTKKVLIFTPQNGARLGVFGNNEPQNSDCLKANLGKDPIVLDAIASGTFFCYQTKLGLPGWLRLVTIDITDHTISLDFLTWAIP